MTTRKALQVGSSVAVTIPKSFLQSRNISVGDDLRIEEVQEGLLIRPASEEVGANKITALTMNFVNRYRKDLEALADK